jgi:hypothetical protein
MVKIEEWMKTSIYLAIFTVFAAVFDLYVSYIAYVGNPFFFIHNEANFEAVLFFHYSQIPIWFISFHAMYIILFTIFLKRFYNSPTATIISVHVVFVGFGHIFGGLTWFDTGRLMHYMVDGCRVVVHFVTLVAIVFYGLYCFRKWRLKGGGIMRCYKCGKVTIFTDGICGNCKEKMINEERGKFQKKEEFQQQKDSLQ